MSRRRARFLTLAALTGALVCGPALAASAHPLGNFTVNHYDGLHVYADRVVDRAVVDNAEIPTLQQRPSIDTNHDGITSDVERSSHAVQVCGSLAASVRASVNGQRVAWHVDASSFAYYPGAIGLQTSRLDCTLTAPATFKGHASVTFADSFEADRVGWHEITATASGVHLSASSVPATSISAELRHYPNDLLSSPLNVRSTDLGVQPGGGANASRSQAAIPTAGFFSRHLNGLNKYFDNVAGARHLTLSVGLLALLLSLVLGASHALLPGHGKTVMAAYIAGRRGSVRDAVTVGATVTVTHTAGVLILGLALTASASLAGESVLGYLGVVSGLLIALIGIGLLRSAWRSLRERRVDRGHVHIEAAVLEPVRVLATVGGPAEDHQQRVVPHQHGVLGHGHGHGHHAEHGHHHGHGHDHPHSDGALGRRGLIGMGVAGGLVPSPSALVVLLGAIALGRTLFGVALVLGYGIGMALTLTAAGLLLVRLRGRMDHSRFSQRFGRRAVSLSRITPIATATLVLIVGGGLALRSLTTVL